MCVVGICWNYKLYQKHQVNLLSVMLNGSNIRNTFNKHDAHMHKQRFFKLK